MFRDEKDAPGVKTVNCLLADGGLGDHIGALVAVDYAIRTYSYINYLVWVPDYLLEFAKHVLPKEAIVRDYTEAQKKYDDKRIGITTSWYRHTPMRVHPVDYAFHVMLDEHVPMEKKNYLQIRPDEIELPKNIVLPEKYVVITATAAEKVKTMPTQTINEIAEFIVSKGYVPVFIGKTETDVGYEGMKMNAKAADIKYELGLNLLDRTSVLQTAKVIAGAKAFVGMDGGPVHIAGCTKTDILAGYTFIDPEHNLPIRNDLIGGRAWAIIPDKELKCRFCQTKMNFCYDIDFRSCFYKDYKCVSYMKSDKFIDILKRIL